jgi:hypothetical protein
VGDGRCTLLGRSASKGLGVECHCPLGVMHMVYFVRRESCLRGRREDAGRVFGRDSLRIYRKKSRFRPTPPDSIEIRPGPVA